MSPMLLRPGLLLRTGEPNLPMAGGHMSHAITALGSSDTNRLRIGERTIPMTVYRKAVAVPVER